MPEMQEQFLIARDGVNAENAGAIFGRLWRSVIAVGFGLRLAFAHVLGAGRRAAGSQHGMAVRVGDAVRTGVIGALRLAACNIAHGRADRLAVRFRIVRSL